ncbi:hypothetical protein [Alloacidobacterium sp.]|uniref:hypothetical protein n=1 Tax=Alloacidobacterium sp. TaxID=2951999 RepID=UPI002D60FE2C|nr:hypothetical protein [Alloacidobacterium sp.]HYK35133.1 hypothetical protein [Alloacidobacterium sp.]
MKTASQVAVVALLAMSLSGCQKQVKTPAQPQVQAPILPPSKMVYIPNLPALPPPSLPDVAVATAPPEMPEPAHPRKVARHKPSVAKSDTQGTEKNEQQPAQAGNNAAVDTSPIGQLSSTEEAVSSQGRQNIERQINDTENGLNGIKRSLSSDEQLTSTQIKTFLTKAKQALAENDLDGAQTLADKAKVLLQELTTKK